MKKQGKKITGFILAVLLLVIPLAGCGNPKETAVENPKVVNISYSNRPINVPTIVAREKKFFEDEFAKDGIEVKWFELEGPATTEALAAKSIDIATSFNYVSAIIAKANGGDIKIISSYAKFPKAIGLVAGVDSKVSTIADLKGKKVAVQEGTMLQEMLINALAEANIPVDDVQIFGMASADAVNAVMLKQVDAAVLPEPLLTKAIASKKVNLLRNAEGLILGQSVIAARTDFLQKYPQAAERFLKIQQTAIDWAGKNSDEALQLTAKVNQMDLKAVQALYPKFDFSMGIDENNKQELMKETGVLQRNSFIKNDINSETLINNLVDTGYLPK